MMVKFNLTPCVEIEPKMTLDEARKELEELELQSKRIKARQENLQYIVRQLEKKQERGAA